MPRLLLLLAIAAFTSGAAVAQTCSTEWTNPVDGDWDDPTKWTNGVPTGSTSPGGVDPCITTPGTYTVTIQPDYGVNINLQTFTLGGASGTQTLVSGGSLILTDMTIGENAIAEFIRGTTSRVFSGLSARGTVLVEGVMTANYNGVRGFLRSEGTLEVASGGILRGTDAVLGGSSSTYRIRGLVELADGGRIDAPPEVLGGTVRATSGEGSLFLGGGILRNATLDAGAGASLTVSGDYDVEGTISGNPEGDVYLQRATFTAAASGVTFAVTGTGLQLGSPTNNGFQTVLTGGPILNTGMVGTIANVGILRGIDLTNEGTIEIGGFLSMSDGALLRNRPGAIIRMNSQNSDQFILDQFIGVARVVNEGLIVREARPATNEFTRFLGVTLESLPGSEIRTFSQTPAVGDYLDFTAGPNDDTLPPGVTLSGDGNIIATGLPIRSTFSPGTEAEPIGSLGPRANTVLTLAPEAITVLDVAPDGVSDQIYVLVGLGATVEFGGTLRVRVAPGFMPAIGDSWQIVANDRTTVRGAFSSVEVEGGPPGLSFALDTSAPGTAILRAVAGVSVSAPLAQAQEGTPMSFVLTHPASPQPFSINVETGGTATPFADYTISATRGTVRARANTTQTTVQVFPRRDADATEGPETVTLRVLTGLDAAPGATASASVTITDGPSSTALAVDGISPALGANVGLVTAIVYGTAFSDDLDVRLTGPAIIVGTGIAAFPQAGGLRVTFDLRDQPAGVYDVVVSGDETATLVGGFGVTGAGVEFPIWSAITGTAAPRFGRYSTYTITVGNDGLVDIFDTLVNVLITGASEYSAEQTSEAEGSEGDPDGVEIEDQDVVPIYVYRIPAGGQVQFSMRVRPTASGQPLGVATRLHRPNPKASFTLSGDFDDFVSDARSGNATYWGFMGGYMNLFLNEDATRAATRTGAFGREDELCLPLPIDLSDLDPAEGFTLPNADAALETLREVGARSFVTWEGVTQPDGLLPPHELIHQAENIGLTLHPDASTPEIESAARRTVRNLLHDAADLPRINNRGSRLASSATFTGGLLGISGNCAGGIVGASGDPNDKIGPFGVLAERFTRPDQSAVPYTIRFENMATASFPAQEVVVVDTLDTAVFDLSTFGFGSITWGETGRLTPPTGAQSFEAEVDLSPEIPATLLVTAALDPVSGRVEWHFVTLDPDTDELPEDGTVGFLPPNDTSPVGEGAVQFTIRTREGLPTGTEISNGAEIVFDVNEPIVTPVWTNTVDTAPPVSSVQPLAGAEINPISITVGGSDDGSGIEAFVVYASQDGGAFRAVGVSDDGTFEFEGDVGSTYGFYSRAYDAVDNVEGSKTSAEATTLVTVDGENGPDLPLALTLEAPRPNPAVDLVRVRYGVPTAGMASVRVLDALGREVATLASGEAAAGWHTADWQPDVAAGVYAIELRSRDAVQHRRLTVVR